MTFCARRACSDCDLGLSPEHRDGVALAVAPLPALCNWLCHLAVPGFDPRRGRFCEPVLPGKSIGILHLTGPSKDRVLALRGEGPERRTTLRFPGRPHASSTQ